MVVRMIHINHQICTVIGTECMFVDSKEEENEEVQKKNGCRENQNKLKPMQMLESDFYTRKKKCMLQKYVMFYLNEKRLNLRIH